MNYLFTPSVSISSKLHSQRLVGLSLAFTILCWTGKQVYPQMTFLENYPSLLPGYESMAQIRLPFDRVLRYGGA